jgi:hypothetical protein
LRKRSCTAEFSPLFFAVASPDRVASGRPRLPDSKLDK